MKLTILSTSDMHGYVLPTNFSENEMNLPFGVAKAARVIKRIKATADEPVIMIENGDFIQGSPLSYFAFANGQQVTELTQLINTIGYDAGVLGNHEFNCGQAYLQKAVASYQHPILAANVLNDAGEPYFGTPYTIIEKGPVKVAILGLVTQYIPHWEQPQHIVGMHFMSAVACAKEYVPRLRELADVVIVAYHGGFERDLVTGEPTEVLTGENEGYQLVTEVAGIDALITGHQHRAIATHVQGIPVTQPGYRGNFVGKITLELDELNDFAVLDSQAELLSVENELADEQITELIEPLSVALEKWLDQPLGQVQGDMVIHDPMHARIHEHPYIEFINRVQSWATGCSISMTALFNNEGRGFGETITMREVITNYNYPNTLAVLKITGADLKAALEQTANYLAVENKEIVFNPQFIHPKPQYFNYDMYEGIEYQIDLSQPVGQRITKLLREGVPIQPTDELELVTNQYRAVGGGDYQMFSADKIVKEVQIDMTELIAAYLQEHPVIQATVNQNFQIIA